MDKLYADGTTGSPYSQFRIHALVHTSGGIINTHADCEMQSFNFRLKEEGEKFVRDMELKSGVALCTFAMRGIRPRLIHMVPSDDTYKEALLSVWSAFRESMNMVDHAFMEETVYGRIILSGRMSRYKDEFRFLVAHEIAARYGHYVRIYAEHHYCGQAVLQAAAKEAQRHLEDGLEGANRDMCSNHEGKVDVRVTDTAVIPEHAKIALRRALAHKEINIFADLKKLSKAERRTLHQKVESRIENGQTFYNNDELLQWIEDAHVSTLASREQSKRDRERFKNVRIGAHY